jgi:hypothetical protein
MKAMNEEAMAVESNMEIDEPDHGDAWRRW